MIPGAVTICTTLSFLLSEYPVLPALVISALWFYAGHKYLSEGNLVVGLLWQGIGVLFLMALCVNITLSGNKSWLNLAVAAVAIGIEIWIMKRWWRRGKAHHGSGGG
jgi:hypothetical protein